LNYVINAFGVFPSDSLTLNSLGVVSAFAGNFAPGGELLCDGQLLPISEYSALFELIGTTYGGDSVNTFALPDLRGRNIVGAGDGFTLGEPVGNANVTLTNANSALGSDAPVSTQQPGLVIAFHRAEHGPVLSLLGTTYGGDGTTTFALPNLEGRTALGTGSNGLDTLGQVSGADAVNLTTVNLPPLAAPTIVLADDTGAPGAPGHTTDGQVNVSGIATGAAWSYSTDGGATFTTGTGTSFTLTGDGVRTVLVNQSWGSGDVSPNASLTFTLEMSPPHFFTNSNNPDILWQTTSSGQISIWQMDGANRIGGGPVSSNPGPTWQAIGTGHFNGDGLSDIPWQNPSTGQVWISEMNENTVIGGGAVSPNPGPNCKAIGTGDFNDDGHAGRHPVAEYEHRPGLDLGNERGE
jgi:microcystin-dependent protein